MSSWRSRMGSAARQESNPASNSASSVSFNNANGSYQERPTALLPSTATPAQESRVRKILKLIESEPACKIHELAVQFKLSHSHLQHLFKPQTGSRLGHVMLEHRLLKAAHLLESSSMSVKEIAYAVGYEHTSSFIRAFERRFGQTPLSYRRQNDRRKC
jgi:transcriptional regulator GlxA family with amidase domain